MTGQVGIDFRREAVLGCDVQRVRALPLRSGRSDRVRIRTEGECPWTRAVGTKVGRLTVGQTGVLTKPLPAICCSYVGQPGDRITIDARWSKKRVFVLTAKGSGHKVKASKVWFSE